MPSIAMHYHYGQEVLEKLPEDIRRSLNANSAAFNLGLQGPDIFFFYRPLFPNRITKLGQQIHQQNASILISNAIMRIMETHDDEAISYLAGFTCHFLLDSALHSSIRSIAPTTRQHFALEAEMDRQIIEKYDSNQPNSFKRDTFFKTDAIHHHNLRLIYTNVTAEQLKRSISGMVFYNKLLYSPSGIKKSFLSFCERLFRKEDCFANMIIGTRSNVKYRLDAAKLNMMMEDIVMNGALAVENIFACVYDGAALTDIFDKNFE